MNRKPEYPGQKQQQPLVGCSGNPIILVLMRVSLPSKLRKTTTNNKRERHTHTERQTESYTRAHTLSHIHTCAFTHYCSSMVGYIEGIGGSGRERKKEKKKGLHIQQHIYSHVRSK